MTYNRCELVNGNYSELSEGRITLAKSSFGMSTVRGQRVQVDRECPLYVVNLHK